MVFRPFRTHHLIVLYPSRDSDQTSTSTFRISGALFPQPASTLMYAVCSSLVSVNGTSAITLRKMMSHVNEIS